MDPKQALECAVQQFIGYRHATQGFGVVELVEAMGLEKKEWEEIRDSVVLSRIDRALLNDHFKAKQ